MQLISLTVSANVLLSIYFLLDKKRHLCCPLDSKLCSAEHLLLSPLDAIKAFAAGQISFIFFFLTPSAKSGEVLADARRGQTPEHPNPSYCTATEKRGTILFMTKG